MRDKIISAFKWDFSGTAFSLGFGFVTTTVLARILTPNEFGVVAISMAFIGILKSISSLGFNEALIQNAKNSDLLYSSVYYLNLLLGGSLAIILFLLAPVISSLYNIGELSMIIRILSLVFIFNSFCNVQYVILRIELNFKAINSQNIICNALSGIIGIILALYGWGVYALVTQTVLASLIKCLLIRYYCDWEPKRYFDLSSLKNLFKFGYYRFLSLFFYDLVIKLDELFIGVFFSPMILGYFNRSNSLFNLSRTLISKSINSVFFPVLSSIKNEEERFINVYNKIYNLICIASFLLMGILALLGEALIIGLYGLQWEESVKIYQILMFTLFSYPVNSFLALSRLAKGFSKEEFYLSLIRNGIRLSSLAVAYIYGFEIFLYSLILVSIFNTIFNVLINVILLRIEVIKQIKPLLYSVLSFVLGYWCVLFLRQNNYIFKLDFYFDSIINSILFVIAFILVSTVINNKVIIDFRQTIKLFLDRK